MKLTMTTSLAGADYVLNPGDAVDLQADEAGRLIAAGYAVATGNETADAPQPQLETATIKEDAPATAPTTPTAPTTRRKRSSRTGSAPDAPQA